MAVRKKKGAGKRKLEGYKKFEKGVNEVALRLNAWIEEHSGPELLLDTSEVRGNWEIDSIPYARGLDEEHVRHLMSTFVTTASVNQQIVFVFYGCEFVDEPYDDRWQHTFKEMQEASVGCAPCEGQHSMVAVERLNKLYPRNPTFCKVKIKTILCPLDVASQERIEAWGLRSNYIAGSFKKPSFKDTCFAMHRSFVSLVKRTEENGQKVDQNDISVLKDRFAKFGGISGPYASQVWNIAKRRGKIWDMISQIISGQVRVRAGSRKPKPLKSPHKFNTMGAIPDEVLQDYLARVVDGMWDVTIFYNQCIEYKLVMRVRRMIIEYMLQIRKITHDDVWEEIGKTYPGIDDSLVNLWTRTLTSARKKEKIPAKLKERIVQLINEADSQRRVREHFVDC
jgi:hypothetical protein